MHNFEFKACELCIVLCLSTHHAACFITRSHRQVCCGLLTVRLYTRQHIIRLINVKHAVKSQCVVCIAFSVLPVHHHHSPPPFSFAMVGSISQLTLTSVKKHSLCTSFGPSLVTFKDNVNVVAALWFFYNFPLSCSLKRERS